MNEFVAACRSEWKRLGVPDPVADEMAAELEADLEEAETEGASARDVLGSGAFDPRAFANAWAAERGVIPGPSPVRRRPRVHAAIGGAFALIAIIGAVLAVLAPASAPGRLVLGTRFDPPPGAIALVRGLAVSPDGTMLAVGSSAALLVFDAPTSARIWTVPTAQRISVPAPPPMPVPAASSVRIVSVDVDDSGFDVRTVGLLLLTVGLAGLVPSSLFWLGYSPISR